jgi:multicomponent Na+:H+ antiporter subunit E
MSRVLATLLLAATYLLALASLDPLDAALAMLLAVAVLAGLRRFLFDRPPLGALETGKRLLAFFPFAFAVIVEITRGTWRVALIVLGLQPLRRPGIVLIPVGERSPTGVAVTALAITLSPGELLVDIDTERDVMLIHVLDARDPDAVREHYANFYERYQRRVFR